MEVSAAPMRLVGKLLDRRSHSVGVNWNLLSGVALGANLNGVTTGFHNGLNLTEF